MHSRLCILGDDDCCHRCYRSVSLILAAVQQCDSNNSGSTATTADAGASAGTDAVGWKRANDDEVVAELHVRCT